jgi:hypothetical protein
MVGDTPNEQVQSPRLLMGDKKERWRKMMSDAALLNYTVEASQAAANAAQHITNPVRHEAYRVMGNLCVDNSMSYLFLGYTVSRLNHTLKRLWPLH